MATAYSALTWTVVGSVNHCESGVAGRLEVQIEILWVPGHVKVKDNEQAGNKIKEVMGNKGIRRSIEQFTSLANVN